MSDLQEQIIETNRVLREFIDISDNRIDSLENGFEELKVAQSETKKAITDHDVWEKQYHQDFTDERSESKAKMQCVQDKLDKLSDQLKPVISLIEDSEAVGRMSDRFVWIAKKGGVVVGLVGIIATVVHFWDDRAVWIPKLIAYLWGK